MKTGRLLLIISVLFIAIVIYFNKCNTSPPPSVQGGAGAKQVLKADGIIIRTSPFEDKVFSTGTLLANEEVEIRNEIAGKITSLVFKEGTRVKKGELLLTIYDEDLRAQLKKLELEKETAEKFEGRQRDLLTIKGISQQDYDESLNRLNTVKADIDLLQSQLSKTRIIAPFDGIIGLKTVSQGAYLAQNTLIASMQSIDPIKLEFALPERYRSMISENSEIEFTTESTGGIFKAKIYAFDPKIDLKSRSVLVRALCSNREMKLFPGAFAQIQISLKSISNAILIPTQSVIPELKGQKVIISKNGKVEKAAVETGIRNDSVVQILSGLKEGDTVLTTGIMQARPGISLIVNIK